MGILVAVILFCADLSGPVVGVTDGDTVKVLVSGKEVKVRLAEIDAPERGQAFGAAAKRALSSNEKKSEEMTPANWIAIFVFVFIILPAIFAALFR